MFMLWPKPLSKNYVFTVQVLCPTSILTLYHNFTRKTFAQIIVNTNLDKGIGHQISTFEMKVINLSYVMVDDWKWIIAPISKGDCAFLPKM